MSFLLGLWLLNEPGLHNGGDLVYWEAGLCAEDSGAVEGEAVRGGHLINRILCVAGLDLECVPPAVVLAVKDAV